MRSAFPVVAMLGDRFRRERYGWRDTKALIVLVAEAGDWNGASCLADALGVAPDAQEAIYREVYGANPPHPIRSRANVAPVPESEPDTTATERRTA